jgi:hypothetical protein
MTSHVSRSVLFVLKTIELGNELLSLRATGRYAKDISAQRRLPHAVFLDETMMNSTQVKR